MKERYQVFLSAACSLLVVSAVLACNHSQTVIDDGLGKRCGTVGFRNCSYVAYSAPCEHCQEYPNLNKNCWSDESYQVMAQPMSYGDCIGDYSKPPPYQCINGTADGEPYPVTCYYTSTSDC
jgi:hypothetical protein